jgi:hypothetical protein
MLQVPDDSGFLALVVPATYQSFVDKNWDFEQLRGHFRRQMAARAMLIWGTGLEGYWNVEFRIGAQDVRGFREVTGPICVVGGSVLVTSYESLTMAAQFDDVRLPQTQERDQQVEVPDGGYRCRVVQMFDPNGGDSAEDGSPDFVLVLSELTEDTPAWSDIPWFTDG